MRLGVPFLAMEFVDGPDLAAVIKKRGPQPLPLPLVVEWMKQAASVSEGERFTT